MNYKSIMFLLCMIFACILGTGANAEAKQYIVYLKSENSEFSKSGENYGKRYEVVDGDTLSEYLSCGIVEFYEPDYEVKTFEDFSMRGASSWNLDAINVQKAWDIGCYGNDVTVAVIDSGAYAHPDLANNLLAGHNYLDNNSDTSDNIGHGTYVSGIIAAEANGEFIDGVANRAKIVPLKCFAKDRSTQVSMLSNAVYDAVNVYHADVINMSFGMKESVTTTAFRNAIQYAIQNDCIVVAAVGNDGKSTIYYPANYDGVIGVGSVDSNIAVSSFSQRNATVDVVAPGGGVQSVSIEGFNNNSGTSFACPHVSAMAAIAKCIKKDITAAEFQVILKETSRDLGTQGYDTNYGYGLINIESMIDKLLENTEIFMSPIDDDGKNLTVTIYNNGENPINALGMAAEYENGVFRGMNKVDINLASKETEVITKKKGKIKFMLWQNLQGMTPLTQQRCSE